MASGGVDGVDYAHKECFEWTSMIRLPDFVTREVFDWAVQEATAKRRKDSPKYSSSTTMRDFVCSVCMLVLMMPNRRRWSRWMLFAREQGYETDFTGYRRHHEIYLSDPRRTAPEKLKTVLRHPVRAK